MMKYLKYIKNLDPCAKNILYILLFYPGVHALINYRIAHFFIRIKLNFIAEFISYLSRLFTGIEINPNCTIGKYLFIDHGMGVVIGETAVIGDYCTIYQGVTLGANKLDKKKRHPTIKNNVIIGANAVVIGNITIGNNVKIGANAIVTKTINDNSVIIGTNKKI